MFMQQPVCQRCGQPILGPCLYALNASWHPEHFLCVVCQRPIKDTSFQLHEGQPCHAACFAQRFADRCVYCGKSLTGQFLVDHWGQHFCVEHQGQFPACAYCGRMVPPQQQEVGAGVVRCPVCRAHAIESDVEARPLFAQLVRWLTAQGFVYHNLRLNLELCDRAHLNALLQDRSDQPYGQQTAGYLDHTLGATISETYLHNGRMVGTSVNGVAVLQGLPPTLFQGVTMHELGHVWLLVNGITQLPHWGAEGFCEWLSYLYYQQLHTPESVYYMECKERNTDAIYGSGFRSVRDCADRVGFARFIDTLLRTKQLPA